MTKLEILKSVDKAFTSEVLDKFYSITLSKHNRVSIQGDYSSGTMQYVNEAFGLSMADWEIRGNGYINLDIDGSTENKIFMFNEEQIRLSITLTD